MSEDRQKSFYVHRRAVRREIVLPFAGGVLLLVILMVIAILSGKTPISGISTTLLTVLVLCPFALCLIPVYLVLVVMVVGMNRVHDNVGRPLRRLENLTIMVRDRTYSISDRAARVSINLNAKFAPLDRTIFSLFDRPQPQDEDDDE
jgi:hypothetical protein